MTILVATMLKGASCFALTTASSVTPWPNATIPFTVEAEKKFPSAILKDFNNAIDRINGLKIVKLVKVDEKAALTFDGSLVVISYKPKKKGEVEGICRSWGFGWRDGTSVLVQLSEDCSYGKTLHELFHALGLLHEQVSPNRNIELIQDHLGVASADQYFQEDAIALTPYDVNSIMHYSSFVNTLCSAPTDLKWKDLSLKRLPNRLCMRSDWFANPAKNPGVNCHVECGVFYDPKLGPDVGGQRKDLSDLDIEGLKALYPVNDLSKN